MKTLIAIAATLAVVIGGGVVASLNGLISFGPNTHSASAETSQAVTAAPAAPIVPEIYTTEIVVPGILVSINRDRRQSLLLMDIAIVVHEANGETVTKQRSKVVNSVLRLLNHKEDEYFYKNNFMDVAQKEIKLELTNVLGIKIEDVLITKAVYQ